MTKGYEWAQAQYDRQEPFLPVCEGCGRTVDAIADIDGTRLCEEMCIRDSSEAMQKTAEQLGFGKRYSIDGITTAASVYDVEDATSDGLAWSGIGQYTDLANPYHMARLMGAIANGGTCLLYASRCV